MTKGYIQSQSIIKKLQKQADELHQVRVQLAEENFQDIDTLKATQAEMQRTVAEEITKWKKVQDHLIIEQAQMCARCGEVEQVVSEACQHIFENIAKINPIEKAK